MGRVTDGPIGIPSSLRRVHPVVERTRDAYAGVKPDDDGRMRPRPRAGVARLIVSEAGLRRALLVLQAVFVEGERRGWEVEPSTSSPPGVAIVAGGHRYCVSVQELHDREPMTDEDVARWRRQNDWKLRWHPETKAPILKSVPNGFMKLSLDPAWSEGRKGRNSWSEGPRGPLDRKLPQFFAEIEARIAEDDRRAEERAQQAELRRQEGLERLERQRLAKIENKRVERLTAEVRAWGAAGEARKYVEALRVRADELEGDERIRVTEWCAWAEAWVQRSNPVTNTRLIAGVELEIDPWER